MKSLFMALPLLAFVAAPVSAKKIEDCSGAETVGTLCKTPLSIIHPTQFAVGMVAVQYKAEKLSSYKEEDLKKYIHEHPAPAVFGPGSLYYIVDHHHLALALMKIGKGKIVVQVKRKAANMAPNVFWQMMASKKWVYPFDENGKGPLDPGVIPANLLAMRDDPYRSLAWAVREQEGYEKSTAPFAEFKWAQFFRERVTIGKGKEGFQKAVKRALELAASDEAKHLPGVIGDDEE